MNKTKIYFFILTMILFGIDGTALAQSRWIGIMPMEFNPSFAGSAGGNRFVALSGYGYSSSGGNVINTYKFNAPLISISYDNFVTKLASGIGFYFSWTNISQKSEPLDYYMQKRSGVKAGLMISPKISIKGKYTIAPSLGMSYKKLHYDLKFDSITTKIRSDNFMLNAGLLINGKNFYIGYAYYFPINSFENKNTFYEENGNDEKPYGYIQAGYKIPKKESSKASYTIQTVLRTGTGVEWYTFVGNVTGMFKYKKILLGTAHTQGRLHACIGFQTKKIRIVYAQNISSINIHYSGELSFRLIVPNKNRTFYQF